MWKWCSQEVEDREVASNLETEKLETSVRMLRMELADAKGENVTVFLEDSFPLPCCPRPSFFSCPSFCCVTFIGVVQKWIS